METTRRVMVVGRIASKSLTTVRVFHSAIDTQGLAKGRAGLVNFVPAVAYHFCLALLAFTHPGACLLAKPCTFCSTLYRDRLKGRYMVW